MRDKSRAAAEASGGGSFAPVDEIRLGAFYDIALPKERDEVLASIVALSSPLPVYGGGNPFLGVLLNPRLAAGGMINTSGLTSYAFAGANWRLPIYGRLFLEGEFGGALNNSASRPNEARIDLGCRLTFREAAGLGVQITSNVDIIGGVEHISHANLCGADNPGLTSFGVRLGYKF